MGELIVIVLYNSNILSKRMKTSQYEYGFDVLQRGCNNRRVLFDAMIIIDLLVVMMSSVGVARVVVVIAQTYLFLSIRRRFHD